jgi:hypothetical protein
VGFSFIGLRGGKEFASFVKMRPACSEADNGTLYSPPFFYYEVGYAMV